jgi:hypothetical protein
MRTVEYRSGRVADFTCCSGAQGGFRNACSHGLHFSPDRIVQWRPWLVGARPLETLPIVARMHSFFGDTETLTPILSERFGMVIA